MPRAVNYKANSVVYFEGDRNEFIYILQSGGVLLRYTNIETGVIEQDLIKTGEFFGVKSALGRYPKDETAMIVRDSTVLVLTVPEFEAIVTKNSRVIIKMLRVFSNQLRRIHKQVSNLISHGKETIDAEKGLYDTGEYYYKNSQFKQAAYIFKQYLIYYPQGEYVAKAQQLKNEAEACQQGKRPAIQVGEANLEEADYGDVDTAVNDVTKEYYNGIALFNQGQFEKALRVFKKVNADGKNSEYGILALADIGKSLFQLKYWDECIKHFSAMFQSYPKHPNLVDGLYFVGECYRQKGMGDKAAAFFKNIQTRAAEDSQIYRKAAKALQELGVS